MSFAKSLHLARKSQMLRPASKYQRILKKLTKGHRDNKHFQKYLNGHINLMYVLSSDKPTWSLSPYTSITSLHSWTYTFQINLCGGPCNIIFRIRTSGVP